MNVLILAGTVLGVGTLALGALVCLLMAAPLRAAVLGIIAGGWAVLYGAAVLAVSLRSHDDLLAPGQTKYFCGFYLDCHVGVAVLGDSVAQAIGGRRASGAFHVLTLRFSSTAVRANQTPWRVQMQLEGADGVRYERDAAAEAALVGAQQLEQEIPPGGSYTVRVVFDVPPEARRPRLLVDQGAALKFPEIVLIGDEGSMLHRKTWLALPVGRAVTSLP